MANALSRAWRYMLGARRAPVIQRGLPLLGPGGPRAGVALPPNRYSKYQTHPLIGADVDKIHNTLLRAFEGYPSTLMDLFDDMVERDGRVNAVSRTRISVIQGRQWSVRPQDELKEDADAKQIAKNCSLILKRTKNSENGGWRSIIGQAGDGVLKGFAVFEIEWGVSHEGWHVPKRLHWRHPGRFFWGEDLRLKLDDAFGRRWRRKGPDYGADLLEEFPDKFLIFTPLSGRASYPTRRGIMLGMLFPSLIKRSGVKWWLKAAERWGQPVPHIRMPQGEENLADAGLEMLNQLRSDGGIATWGGVDIEAIAGTGNVNPAVYSELVGLANTEIAIVGLGQNLTTEVQGGSFAAAKVSNLIRLDLLASDLAELDDWLSCTLLEMIVRYNWPGAAVPVYETEIGERLEPQLADVQAGHFTSNEYRGSKGYGPRADGAGDEHEETAAPSPLGGAAAPDPFALSQANTTTPTGTNSPTSEPLRSPSANALYRSLVASEHSHKSRN